MASNKKIALRGLSRISLFPVLQNDYDGYEVGARFRVPYAQSMSKTPDVTSAKIYADDGIYLDMKSWNGINIEVVFAEMSLRTIAELGFGDYNEATNTLKSKPQGQNNEYALTLAAKQADDTYRMYRWFSFTVNEVVEGEHQTMGDGTEICTFTMKGVLVRRKLDELPGEVHIGTDLAWLDSVESDGEPEPDDEDEETP